MKICMPVDQLNGLDSEIAPNFRAAPALLVIDTASQQCHAIDASGGACGAMPRQIDIIVCAGGMGRGMFNGLRSRGVRVFNTEAITVGEALAELQANTLAEVTEVACCGGGHHGHGSSDEKEHACGCSKHSGEGESGGGCGCKSHH